MRHTRLVIAALAFGAVSTAVVSGAVAASGTSPAGRATTYRDAGVADRPQLDVSGTLFPVESGGAPQYVVSTDDGRVLDVTMHLAHPVEVPVAFHGSVALDDTTTSNLVRRHVHTARGQHLAAHSSAGRTALAIAARSGSTYRVSAATVGRPVPDAAATSSRLYVAVVTNRGTIEESHDAIESKLAAIRDYWHTEGGAAMPSFTSPTDTVYYASSAAPAVADGCGITSPSAVWNEAASRFPGVSFRAPGNHLMVLVADDCANGAAGVGTIGSSLASGGYTLVSLGNAAVAIGVHELGHNYGLEHANVERCAPTCDTVEYYDVYSIMGLAISGANITPPALDTAYRVQLGLAGDDETPAVTGSTTVHLTGRAAATGVRGFVVTDPASGTRYAVDYRSGADRDAATYYRLARSIGSFAYRPGVTVERIESDDSTTLLTRNSGSTQLTSLVAGETMPVGSLSVSVTSASPTAGADVVVTFPGSPTSTATPTSNPTPTPTPTPTAGPTDTPSSTPTSSPTAPTNRFTLTAPPSVVGAPRVGARLTANYGTWTPVPTRVAMQWLLDGRAVRGANGATVVLGRSLAGHQISVRVAVWRPGFPAATATSAPVTIIAAARSARR